MSLLFSEVKLTDIGLDFYESLLATLPPELLVVIDGVES